MNLRSSGYDRITKRFGTPVISVAVALLLLTTAAVPRRAGAQDAAPEPASAPLARKQEMIRDRFSRLEERMFRLREKLLELEPENAARLGRALERGGELTLQERLDRIVELLDESSSMPEALDLQAKWLADADQLLAILLERDADNTLRDEELERLEQLKAKLDQLFEAQRALRNQTARSVLTARALDQLEQARRQLDAIQRQQESLDTDQNDDQQDDSPDAKHAGRQEQLSREAQHLAAQVHQLSEQLSQLQTDAPDPDQAQQAVADLAQSLRSAAQAMQRSAQQRREGARDQAEESVQQGRQELEQVREDLERLREILRKREAQPPSAQQQNDVAEQAQQLGNEMRGQGDQQQSNDGQQNTPQPPQPAPGSQQLDQAQDQMRGAAQRLEEQDPPGAVPPQDRALDLLEQARRALEEQLQQLRREERAETLRDLESRLRSMLTAQRAVNEATVELDGVGRENFKRAEELRLADLSAREAELSRQAATCVHILDEEGTTIAFPSIITQLVQDMQTVADRLAQAQVGALTQQIEAEIVETLEQLLEAVHQMQQQNEQPPQQPGPSSPSDQNPLLPASAELKLLRAGQLRVNRRTALIEESRQQGTESAQSLDQSLKDTANRQSELSEIARKMREREP